MLTSVGASPAIPKFSCVVTTTPGNLPLKGNALVYLAGTLLALILLESIVGVLFSFIPTIVFLLAALIAVVCAYAIYTEKDGRRIAVVDRLFGIVTVVEKMSRFDARDSVPDPAGEPKPVAAPPIRKRIDYAGVIDDIRSKPITKSTVPQPGAPANPAPPKIDYEHLIAKINVAAPAVMSKEALIGAIGKNVIGQRAAIETIATYVRGKIGARDSGKNKPLVFLLPGPTGTGKTEISKALAEALETKLVRFDMGEYGDDFKASNLFGSPKGYIGSEDGGALPNAIRQGGRRLVILFDEVEKAHASIWQKMLAFLDEGRAGDAKGDVVAPKDTIVLMTTNRRAEDIAENPAAARETLRHDGYFSPEFLGRVEKVVAMPRLTDADMMELTHRLCVALGGTYGLALEVDEEALVLLYAESRNGAQRSGGRGIMERLKDLLIEDLLELQGDGRQTARVVIFDGNVRAVPA